MILLGLHLGSGLLVATAVMSGRTVPHAHPATAEYEFANPSRLGEQRFGEDVDPWRVRAALSHDGILNLEAPRGGRHLDTEVNEVYISLLPAPPDPEEEEETPWEPRRFAQPGTRKCATLFMSENQLRSL